MTLRAKVTRCDRYGNRGDDQKGIHLVASVAGGKAETYQVRQYRKFTAADVRRTVDEHEYPAGRHTILVASVVGVGVRDEVRKHRKWRLLDWTDIR